ncbi:MAG: 6-phosphofructokinase [Lachnospiraceae bacterium]|nr:6-phosphofructokinase [Lachnospiraceae bacterium]
MSTDIKTIAVLTSGGDSPGMNACARAVIRAGIAAGYKVKGIQRGYAGLLEEDITELTSRSAADILSRGGTFLYTSRSRRFATPEGLDAAAKICRKHEIDALIVIGGDGSFKGARELAGRGVRVIGIPGTIDLDIACTDYTIGFDTAVNTAMDAIDKVRDTSTSHERCSIIEVMGRNAGWIAVCCGIANGAEEILVPENYDYDEQKLADQILDAKQRGKTRFIIVNAEGIGHSTSLAKRIEAATGIETRATILGYLQRGGNPTARDRVMASVMGVKAIEVLKEGRYDRIIAFKDGKYVDIDINEALEMQKDLDDIYLKTAAVLN